MQIPVFRISLQNATLLSVVYLAASLLVEVARVYTSLRWAEGGSRAFESVPASTLELLGLFGPLRRGLIDGQLGAFEVRLAFGFTAVAVIFALALVVGTLMWLCRWVWHRLQRTA